MIKPPIRTMPRPWPCKAGVFSPARLCHFLITSGTVCFNKLWVLNAFPLHENTLYS